MELTFRIEKEIKTKQFEAAFLELQIMAILHNFLNDLGGLLDVLSP
jgi:hypothetical protein